MATNILVVDDEKEIADLVEWYLSNEGFTVYKFYTAAEALKCISTTKLDLAVLDVMIPGTDGFALCLKIRETHHYPILMLTAKVDHIDKITGLTLGADDYITKPFNPLEMVARVKAQLRRYTRYNSSGGFDGRPCEEASEFDFAGLIINKNTHKCSLYGKPLNLTPIEFSILWYLCENRGKVVSSEELFQAVWSASYMDNNNTVIAHIGRLREKMKEPPRNPKFIKTIWGVGYQIEKNER